MILVTGATGSIGRHLVGLLRQRQARFRALVRSEDKGRELGCDYAVGDFDDPASVARALRGVDRVFLNAGGAVPVAGEQPMIRQQVTAIDAAAAAGVAQVVKVSVWGARPGGRLATGAHWLIEQHLAASGLAWSVLQPSGFMQNFLTGAGTFTADGKLIDGYGGAAVSYVDARDIAACAAALLTGPARNAETFVLTGPEPLTHADVAVKLSAALGQPVEHFTLPPGELAATLRDGGVPAQFADDVAALASDVADGALAATTPAVHDLTGRAPRTFDQFLAASLPALRAALASLSRVAVPAPAAKLSSVEGTRGGDEARKSPKDTFITIYGRMPVLEVLQDDRLQVDKLIVADNARGDNLDRILDLAERRGVPVRTAPPHRVKMLAGNGKQDQGVLADVVAPQMRTISEFTDAAARERGPCQVLILDGVNNPQNVGMIIRTATAAGLAGVVLPRVGSPDIDPLVIKASAGVAFHASVIRCRTAAEAAGELSDAGFRVYGLDGEAPVSLYEERLPDRAAFVLGNETEGIADETADWVDSWLSIPMAGGVESLNVATSAAVVCFDLVRRAQQYHGTQSRRQEARRHEARRH